MKSTKQNIKDQQQKEETSNAENVPAYKFKVDKGDDDYIPGMVTPDTWGFVQPKVVKPNENGVADEQSLPKQSTRGRSI